MDNIIMALFRYAKDWTIDSDNFKWQRSEIVGEDAIKIVMELNDNEYVIKQLSEKIMMLEDYNRLLREENTRLRNEDEK